MTVSPKGYGWTISLARPEAEERLAAYASLKAASAFKHLED